MPDSFINRQPSDHQLRQFAVTGLVMLPLVTGISSRSLFPTVIAFVAGMSFAVVGVVRPQWLRPLFIGLSILTWPIGVVIHELVLFVVYFLVFTPIGLMSRVLGRDPLRLRPPSATSSNWQPCAEQRDTDSYFRMS